MFPIKLGEITRFGCSSQYFGFFFCHRPPLPLSRPILLDMIDIIVSWSKIARQSKTFGKVLTAREQSTGASEVTAQRLDCRHE